MELDWLGYYDRLSRDPYVMLAMEPALIVARHVDAEPGCPVCGGEMHYELLLDSEEVVCDDSTCDWPGIVIATLEDTE